MQQGETQLSAVQLDKKKLEEEINDKVWSKFDEHHANKPEQVEPPVIEDKYKGKEHLLVKYKSHTNKEGEDVYKWALPTEVINKTNKLSINDLAVKLAKELAEDINLITVVNEDEEIIYKQDRKSLIYELLNKKSLMNDIIRKLATLEKPIYIEEKMANTIAQVIISDAYSNIHYYEDIKNIIMVDNGIISVDEKGVRFYEVSEYDLVNKVALKRMYINYKENLYTKPNQVVQNFFSGIMMNDEKLENFLWHVLATPFVERNKYEKAFIFYGGGSNGKSALYGLMRNVFGAKNNISAVELGEFDEKNLALMDKKMINWTPDLEKYSKWDNFKKVVSGEPVIIRPLYSNPVSKEVNTQIFANSNVLPKLGANRDGGYTRRLEYVPFLREFKDNEKDHDIHRKLNTRENYEWIFSKIMSCVQTLALDLTGVWFNKNKPQQVIDLFNEQKIKDSNAIGLMDFIENNSWISGSEIKISTEHIENNDNFVSEKTIGEIKDGYVYLLRSELGRVYKDFCKYENTKPMGKNTMEEHIEKETDYELDKNKRLFNNNKTGGFRIELKLFEERINKETKGE